MKYKLITKLIVFVVTILGVISSVWAVNNFENYGRPYLFGFIFGGIGIVIGVLVSKLIENKLELNRNSNKYSYNPKLLISISIMGFVLLISTYIDSATAELVSSEELLIINKQKQYFRSRNSFIHSLYVKIGNNERRIICNEETWNRKMIDQKIKINIYKSKFNFDYIDLDEIQY